MESFKNPKVKSEFEPHLWRDMSFLEPICRNVNFHCGFLTVPKVLEKVKNKEAVDTPILHMHAVINKT